MQATGQTLAQALSWTSMHGSAITKGIPRISFWSGLLCGGHPHIRVHWGMETTPSMGRQVGHIFFLLILRAPSAAGYGAAARMSSLDSHAGIRLTRTCVTT